MAMTSCCTGSGTLYVLSSVFGLEFRRLFGAKIFVFLDFFLYFSLSTESVPLDWRSPKVAL